MNEFWLCFVPLFVAVDAIGILPIFSGLTCELDPPSHRKVVLHAVFTASSVAIFFLMFGPQLLLFLGITVPDFMISGGILLLAISLADLFTGEKTQRKLEPESMGAFPIGIPLITGPGVLTTCMLLANVHGKMITTLAFTANIVFLGVVFCVQSPLKNLLGLLA
jgi:multiple antibiotic resistance protein